MTRALKSLRSGLIGTVVVTLLNSSTATAAENQRAGATSLPQAPIGHRQPRADQVPSEKNPTNPNNPVSKEDALLDKKLKSICRGC